MRQQPMTIRNALWSRIVRNHLYWGVWCILVIAGLALLPNDFSRGLWIPAALLAMAIPYGVLVARIACPSCKFPFFLVGFYRIKQGSRQYRVNFCPHCGIGLDTSAGADASAS